MGSASRSTQIDIEAQPISVQGFFGPDHFAKPLFAEGGIGATTEQNREMYDHGDPGDDRTAEIAEGVATVREDLEDGQSYLASRKDTEVVEDDFNLVGAVVNVRSSRRSSEATASKVLSERIREDEDPEDDGDDIFGADISRLSSDSENGEDYLAKRKDTEVWEDDFNLVGAVVNTKSLNWKRASRRQSELRCAASAPASFFARDRFYMQAMEEEEQHVRQLRTNTDVLEDDCNMVAAVVVNSSPERRRTRSSVVGFTPIFDSLQVGATGSAADAIADAVRGGQ